MTSPRTPRQWNAGDAEPEDRPVLRDHAPGAGFVWETPLQREGMWGNDYGQWMPWAKVLEHYGPLSEVLPETPEPPQEDRQLLDWIVPDHIGCVETDGYVEITCRAVAGECSQTTSVQNREWIEEFLTKHAHGQPVKRCPVPASQSVPAVPVSSTGGKEAGEDASEAQGAFERDLADILHDNPTLFVYADAQSTAARVMEHFLSAGWQPPLPHSETEVQWSVREQGDERFYYHPTTDEEDAREEASCREGNTLGKRQAWFGPWIEVTSPLSGEALRDVEERDDAAGDLP